MKNFKTRFFLWLSMWALSKVHLPTADKYAYWDDAQDQMERTGKIYDFDRKLRRLRDRVLSSCSLLERN
jgi:hypothetical protein